MRSYSQKLWSAAHSCRAPPRGIRWPTRAPGRRNHSLAHGLQEGLNRPGSRAPAPDKSRSWGASETWRSAQASPASACSLFPPHTPATPHVSVCGKGVTLRDGVTVRMRGHGKWVPGAFPCITVGPWNYLKFKGGRRGKASSRHGIQKSTEKPNVCPAEPTCPYQQNEVLWLERHTQTEVSI